MLRLFRIFRAVAGYLDQPASHEERRTAVAALLVSDYKSEIEINQLIKEQIQIIIVWKLKKLEYG